MEKSKNIELKTNLLLDFVMNNLSEKLFMRIWNKFEEAGLNLNQINVNHIDVSEPKTDEEYLTRKEVCKLFKIKLTTLDSWKRKKHLLPDTYIGISPRYRKSSILKYLNK